jgi:hypothetical protein
MDKDWGTEGGGGAAIDRGRGRTRKRAKAGRRSGGSAEQTGSGAACWLRRVALGKMSRVASGRRAKADGVATSRPERWGAPARLKTRG